MCAPEDFLTIKSFFRSSLISFHAVSLDCNSSLCFSKINLRVSILKNFIGERLLRFTRNAAFVNFFYLSFPRVNENLLKEIWIPAFAGMTLDTLLLRLFLKFLPVGPQRRHPLMPRWFSFFSFPIRYCFPTFFRLITGSGIFYIINDSSQIRRKFVANAYLRR